MNAELPYDETSDPRWGAAVDEMAWARSGDEAVCKRGPCPCCGHEVTFVDAARPTGDREGSQRLFEECNCEVVHPGTPPGRIGCGANGMIRRVQADGSSGAPR